MKTAAIILLLVGSSISAPDPNGCIESCFTQRLAGLQAEAQKVDFSRPGNWTEQNQFATDGGHGQVHEEHGRYQDTAKHLKYFRKNYSASFGDAAASETFGTAADNFGGFGSLDEFHKHSHTFLESQKAAIEEMKKLARLSGASYQGNSARLEDLSHSENTLEMNKRKGAGFEKAFEEQGQGQNGNTHFQYYKKNYTSAHSTVIPSSSYRHRDLHQGHQNSYEAAENHNSRLKTESVNNNYQNGFNTGYQSSYGTADGYNSKLADSNNQGYEAGQGNYQQKMYESHEASQHARNYESSRTHKTGNLSPEYNQGYREQNSGVTRGDQAGESVAEVGYSGAATGNGFQQSSYPTSETVHVSRPGLVRKYEESHRHASYQETVPEAEHARYQLARQQVQNQGAGYASQSAYSQQAGYLQHSAYSSHGSHAGYGSLDFGSPVNGKLVTGVVDMGHVHTAECVHGEPDQAQYLSQYRRY